jgi:hypothetical protein
MQGPRLGLVQMLCLPDKQRFLDGLDPGADMLCVRRAVSDSNAAGHGAVPAALECKNHSRGPARPSALINPTHVRRHSVVVSTSSAVLSGKVNLWVHNAHMTCQCIVAREGFFLDTQCAANFLLARIVDRVLVSSEIIGAGEDGVAGLAGSGVDALTLVRPRLRVPV